MMVTSTRIAKFYDKCKVTEKQVFNAGYNYAILKDIYDDYKGKLDEYQNLGTYAVQTFLKKSSTFHSIKYRVKTPESLIEKVVRKGKNKNWTVKTYENNIDDLIGIRILLLDRNGWKDIHKFIDTNRKKKEYIAYLREQDSTSEYLNFFSRNEISQEKKGYSSFHYIVLSAPRIKEYRIEVQVRSLLEEVRGETEHLIRYKKSHKIVKEKMLDIGLTGLEELVTKGGYLVSFLCNFGREGDKLFRHKVHNLVSLIDDLPLEVEQKKSLKEEMYKFLYPEVYLTESIVKKVKENVEKQAQDIQKGAFWDSVKRIEKQQNEVKKQLETARIPTDKLLKTLNELKEIASIPGLNLPKIGAVFPSLDIKSIFDVGTIKPILLGTTKLVESQQDVINSIKKSSEELSKTISTITNGQGSEQKKQIELLNQTIKDVRSRCETLVLQNQEIVKFVQNVGPKLMALMDEETENKEQ